MRERTGSIYIYIKKEVLVDHVRCSAYVSERFVDGALKYKKKVPGPNCSIVRDIGTEILVGWAVYKTRDDVLYI